MYEGIDAKDFEILYKKDGLFIAKSGKDLTNYWFIMSDGRFVQGMSGIIISHEEANAIIKSEAAPEFTKPIMRRFYDGSVGIRELPTM